ncbi:Lsa family ABC-F type ribosomal protection protein [Clostridia bacterium]|nr:Lsa family ABC-F type ribosomal protection protein [Clostridia bacterium]
MSLVQINNLTFGYDGSFDNVFENVSFRFDTDWRLGLTGRNGRGKTTLLNLLAGKYEYRGEILTSVRFDYFPFAVGDSDTLTSEVVGQIAPDCEAWKLAREMSLLELGDDILTRPFGTLSMGERTKLMLAALFLRGENGGFLLIDEPTNHLDVRGRELTARYLRGKGGFLLVSHDRVFLDACIDHIISINRADIEVLHGNFSTWREEKRRRDEAEIAKNDRLKKDIGRLTDSTRRAANWSDKVEKSKIGEHAGDRGALGAQAARMMKRAKNIQRRRDESVEEKSGLMKNLEKTDALRLSPLTHHSPRLVVLEDVSIRYGDKTVCENVSFTVGPGQRLALSGRNGSGKSSLLKLILGGDIPHSGSVRLASGLKISYVSQDTSGLSGDLKSYARDCGVDQSLFMSVLRKLDFPRVQFEKDMLDFSGGQKKKVLVARSLCEEAHLYVWDEPLNFVDILSRIQIEELLLEFKPSMIFVEHDKGFTENAATDFVEL